MHRFLVRFALFVILFLTLDDCHHSTEPPSSPRFKDPRTYTWTVDTLAYPGSMQTLMSHIWGSSSKDLYVVGHNDRPGPGTMYHYDGTKWSTTRFHAAEGGPISGVVEFGAIFGFAANDVWAAGLRWDSNPSPPPDLVDSTLVIHFDGQRWSEGPIPRRRGLFSIWGSEPSDIWASGLGGTLFHYQQGNWLLDSVLITPPVGAEFQLGKLTGSSSTVYLIASAFVNALAQNTYYLCDHTGDAWALVDSFTMNSSQLVEKFGPGGLWLSPSKTLYSCGQGVWRLAGAGWVRLLDLPTTLVGIRGTSDENIFVVGQYGKVFHFNGSDWFQLKSFEDTNVLCTDVWVEAADAFIVGYTVGLPQVTLVWHGR